MKFLSMFLPRYGVSKMSEACKTYSALLCENNNDSVENLLIGIKDSYLCQLEMYLFGEELEVARKLIEGYIDRLDYSRPVHSKELLNKVEEIKSLLLSGEEGEKILSEYKLPPRGFFSNELIQRECHYYLKYIGIKPWEARKLFFAAHKRTDNPEVLELLHLVGAWGIAGVLRRTAKNADGILEKDIILKIRKFYEVYRFYIYILRDMSFVNKTENPAIKLLCKLLYVSYDEGRSFRDIEFFSDEIMSKMSSFGTSHKMKEVHSKKEPLYQKAIDYAEACWKENDQRQHHEMAKYLISLPEFKVLKVTPLRERLVRIAKTFNKVRGVRNG